jgi:hypothetical protein
MSSELTKKCRVCSIEKVVSLFVGGRTICKDCNNQRRRDKYNSDEEHRTKLIQAATDFKHAKVLKRQEEKEIEQKKLEEEIGANNRICKYCNKVISKDNFRHNRLKCIDCERLYGREYRQSDEGKEKTQQWNDNNREKLRQLIREWNDNNRDKLRQWHKDRLANDPVYKFITVVRSRIRSALEQKQMSSIQYLGCNSLEYYNWIEYNMDDRYNINEHGKVWHIDHVIPLAQFDLTDEKEQLLAFNWRNTSPLEAKENLRKNKNIIRTQIIEHLNKLRQYHNEKNIELPDEYIELYARHLDAGNSLEPMIPSNSGNANGELG